MIDALFGSKTRVKLLHLFLSSPDQPFYVREITRLIDEQINSVRRELSNMLEVGVILSESVDNKLFYQTNKKFQYYAPLSQIFSDTKLKIKNESKIVELQSGDYEQKIAQIEGVRVAVLAGVLVGDKNDGGLDLILAGDMSSAKIKSLMSSIEKKEGFDISYAILSYDEFYYRLSVRDKFIMDIINNKHKIVVDTDKVLSVKK